MKSRYWLRNAVLVVSDGWSIMMGSCQEMIRRLLFGYKWGILVAERFYLGVLFKILDGG